MCGAPDVPKPVERQAVQVPKTLDAESMKAPGRKRLMLAGLMTGATGALGTPSVGKTTLG